MTDTTAGEGVIERLCAAMLDGVGCTPWHSGAWDSDGTDGASRQGVRDSVRRILAALAAQPSAGAQGEVVGVDRDWMIKVIRERSLPQDAADMIIGAMRFAATPAQPDTGDVAALREALEDIFGDGEEPELCNGNANDLLAIQYWNTARKALAALSKPNAPGAAEDGGA